MLKKKQYNTNEIKINKWKNKKKQIKVEYWFLFVLENWLTRNQPTNVLW